MLFAAILQAKKCKKLESTILETGGASYLLLESVSTPLAVVMAGSTLNQPRSSLSSLKSLFKIGNAAIVTRTIKIKLTD